MKLQYKFAKNNNKKIDAEKVIKAAYFRSKKDVQEKSIVKSYQVESSSPYM